MNEYSFVPSSLILHKCWQAPRCGLVFQATLINSEKSSKLKGYFSISPTLKDNLFIFSETKPDVLLSPTGLASMIRKHCPSSRIVGLGISNDESSPSKTFARLRLSGTTSSQLIYLVISTKPKPEIDFIIGETSYFRLQEKSSYSIKKDAAKEFLAVVDLTTDQFSLWIHSMSRSPDSDFNTQKVESSMPLSLERRSARDKVLRRLKTLKKTLLQDQKKIPTALEITTAREDAHYFSGNIWRFTPKMTELQVTAADDPSKTRQIKLKPGLTGGENLDKLFERVKKLERSLEMQTQRTQQLKNQILELNAAAEKLRNSSIQMSSLEISTLLSDLKLGSVIKSSSERPRKKEKLLIGRRFSSSDSIMLTVGRNAEESDKIVKGAKSHEWWVHIAGGGHGTHVIISGLPPKSLLPDQVLKEAAILALHFSDRTNALEGEVYCTRRQFVRKTKGLASGLWLVTKSDTYRISYTHDEIAKIFANEQRDGAIRQGI